MIYSPEIANPTSAVASAQVSAQVVPLCAGIFYSANHCACFKKQEDDSVPLSPACFCLIPQPLP